MKMVSNFGHYLMELVLATALNYYLNPETIILN